MSLLVTGLVILTGLLVVGLVVWYVLPRRFRGSESVASAYDNWTQDQLLERLWGEHIHLGYYGDPPQGRDFRAAKQDFVDALAQWGGLEGLPAGTKVLDVGCGIGGSSRRLASRYGFDVLGVSISPGQVERAQQLTAPDLSCRFAVMDALKLDLPDACICLLYTSPSPRDATLSRMPSSA